VAHETPAQVSALKPLLHPQPPSAHALFVGQL
jgi:hypothetical protein